MALYLQHNTTEFKVGDTVKVYQKLVEGGKERTQIFEGLVIKIKGHSGEKTFTVRKISDGIGVERIYPVDSPFVQKVEVSSLGKTKRAKLYYLRNRTGRLALKVKTKYAAKEEEAKPTPKKAAKPEPTKPEETTGNAGGTESKEAASE